MTPEIILKNGQKWKLNTAYEGDCLDFMRLLPDKCIDLVLTDPPYGINVNHNMGRRKGNKPSDYKKVEWDSQTPDKEIFDEIFRISKDQIIWGGNYFIDKIKDPSMCWLFWDKMFSENVSFASGELAWTSFNSHLKKFVFNPSETDRIHPTQKPLKLFKWCLEKYAPENAIVFDPFLGSFTTAVACYHHGLNWIGCEKDPDYFRDGLKRYEIECLQNLLDFGVTQ